MIRVLDVLQLPELRDLELLTPGVGCERAVRSVTVDETAESYLWLTGGEIVLSTGFAVRSGALALDTWLHGLAEREIAALALADRYLETLDQAAILRWAAASEIAVVSVPSTWAWADIIAPVYAHLGRWMPERLPSGERERDLLLMKLLTQRADAEEVQRGCLALGLNIGALDTVAVVRSEPTASTGLVHLRRLLAARLRDLFPEAALTWAGDHFSILLRGSGFGRVGIAGRLEKALAGLVDKVPGISVQAGVGLTVEATSRLAASYEQARRALEFADLLKRPLRVVHYDDLGILRLLQGPISRQDLLAFYRETLKALADDEHEDLRRTLAAYFTGHGSLAACGRKLFLHPHTVRYRLGKVEALSGLSLGDPDDCLALQCALKIGQLLAAGPIVPSVESLRS